MRFDLEPDFISVRFFRNWDGDPEVADHVPFKMVSVGNNQLILVVCPHHAGVIHEIDRLISFFQTLIQRQVNGNSIMNRSEIKHIVVKDICRSVFMLHDDRHLIQSGIRVIGDASLETEPEPEDEDGARNGDVEKEYRMRLIFYQLFSFYLPPPLRIRVKPFWPHRRYLRHCQGMPV